MDFHDFAKRNKMQITNVKQVFRGPDGRRYERLADGSRIPLSGTARDGEVLMFFDGVSDDAAAPQAPAGPAVRDSAPAGSGMASTGAASHPVRSSPPPGTFVDGYGRTLVRGISSGDDRTDGKALGSRLAYEAELRDAWRKPEPESA